MTQRITLRQVATHAGVSATTVSNVIRGWPHISTETRQKVQDAIHALGYVPHPIAQGLRTGRTYVIGFIVPDLANPHFAGMVSITEAIAQEHGYNVLIFNSRDDEILERTCIHQVVNRWVDGLILVQAANATSTTATLQSVNMPVVAMDRVPPDFDGPSVKIDNFLISKLAIAHLYGLGHRKIAHLAGQLEALIARERLEGYHRYLDEYGLAYRAVSEHEGSWGADAGYRGMKQLLDSQAELPTAVYASNDSMAMGALHALYEHGLRVPDDVSVVGVDDIEIARHLQPPLTTVQQPLARMARAGIDLLLGLIDEMNGEGHQQKVETEKPNIRTGQAPHPAKLAQVFAPELVIRQSTAPPKA